MDDQSRAYEERQAIIRAQQQAEIAQSTAARLYAQQVDPSLHTTSIGDWQAAQEYQYEQQQNAREAQLAQEQLAQQQRQAMGG
jgi:hypothetical protein